MTRARMAAAACGALLLCVYIAWPYAASAALLLDLSGAPSAWRSLLPFRAAPVDARDVLVPTRHGDVPGRIYAAGMASARAIVVIPGIHGGGVDEPRLDALARRLAGSGATVLSLPVPDLRAYRIVPSATDMIEDATVWFATLPDRTWTRVGLIGVSFSGGLAIVAAGRATLQDKLTAVISLGGHGDLPRAMTYLCTAQLPDGTRRAPHDYGVAVLVRTALPRLIPPTDLPAADLALVAFLDGSSIIAADPEKADTFFQSAERTAAALGEPARSIVRSVLTRNVAGLGDRMLPFVEDLGGHPALSPERSALPRVPIFLIHGRDDDVIPSTETRLLAAHLSRHGVADVRWLVTPLVSHADLRADAALIDRWRLVEIWTAIWSALTE